MVVARTQIHDLEKREAIKRPLSVTRMMLDILESPHGVSHEHSVSTRFNMRPVLALSE